MTKKRFGFIAGWLIIGLVATGFLEPRYSLLPLVPLTIVAALAYAFFSFEKPSDDARVQVLGILIVFVLGTYFYSEQRTAYRHYMRDVLAECERHRITQDNEYLQLPFERVCKQARQWDIARREPPLGRLWQQENAQQSLP